jgi:MinD-like ATPase involved in chromosome partitioning or flagellar assembly/tetratricopeptide (TPR) repeat protein
MTDVPPADSRNGQVVTFYSYKGGTGRTMAMANVAWILASNGYQVLAADWDLESPGLHRFFAPFLDQSVQGAQGILDMVREYEWRAKETDVEEERSAHIAEYTRVQRYAIPLKHWTFPGGGSLEYLSPGQQNRDYMATLAAVGWDTFHTQLSGGEFLDALRSELKEHYDYALIDSRTGLSDVADICTVNLPDVLVDCFTFSEQGIDGASSVARRIEELYGYKGIRILPVAMRVDPSEQERAEQSRAVAQRRFEGLPAKMTAAQRRVYWANVEVPYRPYYSYEEVLAVFGDTPGVPGSMLSAYERIASYVTGGATVSLPVIDEDLRNLTRARFDRRLPQESKGVTLEFLPADQIWAEWISALLVSSGYVVKERRLGQAVPENADGEEPRTLTIVSEGYFAWERSRAGELAATDAAAAPDYLTHEESPSARSRYAASVLSAPRALPEFMPAATVQLGSARNEFEAVERLDQILRVIGGGDERAAALPRFPGESPQALSGVGAPVGPFTGRERELQDLREQLRSLSTAVVRPVTLVGAAGAGKTSIALEYVHRYMNDYDMVCWIPCGEPAEASRRIAELDTFIRDRFGYPMPTDATVEYRAEAVLEALSDGKTVPRWLIVYDNAEDIDAIRRYMPASGGRVLITSQNQGWEEYGERPLRVRMFERPESLAYLFREMPQLDRADAEELAVALGDMPLALAAAAAYLRDSGYPVASYLSALERPRPAGNSSLETYPAEVSLALEAPLRLLRERSPASFRLLELCSLMAPDVGRDLVYSGAMAAALVPYDAALVEPLLMGRVVQEASKLNLMTADAATRQISVHRVVQRVVRSRLPEQEEKETGDAVQRILLAARPRRDVDDSSAWDAYRLLWPHLGPAGVVSSTDERVRQLVIDQIRYMHITSDYDRGIIEGRAVTERWEQLLASELAPVAERTLRTQLLQLRFYMGNILQQQSRFTEARALHTELHAAQESLLGAEHPHTMMTVGSLAADLRALGLYQDALRLDQDTYSRWVRVYGEDSMLALRSANNLAVSYRLNGDIASARDLDKTNYSRLRDTNPEHELTFAAGRNLARDYLEGGEYRSAVDTAREVYASSSKSMGADSLPALDARVLLGVALRGAGKPEEAKPHFDEALQQLRNRLSDVGSSTLACRLSRSVNLWALDELAEAEAEMHYVLAEYQRELGPNHPHTLVCQVNLASTLRRQLEQDKAAAAIASALDGLERVLGPEHPYTLAATMVDGVLLADRGDYDKAAEAEARALAALTRVLGPTHPDTLRCRANLLLTRRNLGEDTGTDLARVIGQLELVLGMEHTTVVSLRKNRRLLRVLDPQPF